MVMNTNDPESVKHRGVISTDIRIHPNFGLVKGTGFSNYDYALIHVEQGLIDLNEWVQPICLPTREMCEANSDKNSCHSAHTSGWGATEHAYQGGSDVLMKLDLTLVDIQNCTNEFTKANIPLPGLLNDTVHICGVGELFNASNGQLLRGDACEGDSGIGLVCDIGPFKYAIGLSSFGTPSNHIRCGGYQTPGVFSRVCGGIEWIEQEIGEDLYESTWENDDEYDYYYDYDEQQPLIPIVNESKQFFFKHSLLLFFHSINS